MHLHEAQQLSLELAELKLLVGSNAKREYVEEQWSRPYHRVFIDLVGNTKRQWNTTWGAVEAAISQGFDLDLDDILHDAETRRATPTQTAGRIRAKLDQGWPENVLKAIIDKTLDAGITAETARKAIGGEQRFSCALAADWLKMSEEKRAKLIAARRYVSTPKMDGLRCLFFVNMPNEGVFSRNMKPLKNLDSFLKELKEWFRNKPGVVDGEILSADNSWENSVTGAKKSGSKIAMRFYPFDYIPADEVKSLSFSMTSEQRHDTLLNTIKWGDQSRYVEVVRTPIKTTTCAIKELELNISDGWEGCVLHDLDACYSTKRTVAWIKVKNFYSAEFVITGFLAGTGKHLGRLGAIVVEGAHEGTRVKSEVGTGFSDAERDAIWKNQGAYIGRRAEIKFFSLTADRSLRFPVFLRIRDKE